MGDDVGVKVAGLTEAQRDFIMRLAPMVGCDDPNAANHSGFTYAVVCRGRGLVTCLALSRRGIAQSKGVRATAYEQGRMGFACLTPLGREVRARLMQEPRS